MYSEKIKSQGVELRVGSIEDVKIKCRVVQMNQILVNLINNSIDEISEHNAPWIEISTSLNENKTIAISVKDSGNGIPRESGLKKRYLIHFLQQKPLGKALDWGCLYRIPSHRPTGGACITMLNPHTPNLF